jgi:type IV pilus assembly protein PilQ
VNWDIRRYGLAIGCTATLMAAVQPAQAAQTEITGVQVTPAGQGFELILKTQGNARPPVFTVNRGNASVADVSNAQLRLPNGSTFNQSKPAPGIDAIEMRQLDANTVRITVQGSQAAPISDTVRRDERQGVLVLRFNAAGSETGAVNATPSTGQAPNAGPVYLRRAVAPPVGDMAVGNLNANPDAIELSSGQVIPKLLLRNAPVREVLTLLGRSANVNVAFAEEGGSDSASAGAASGSGSTISLDIENESVQDVFNYVLRLSGLQANKVGNTIFVGKTLPGDAQNRVMRTLRLNQLRAAGGTKITNSLKTESSIGGKINSGSAADGASSSGDSTSSSTTTRANNIEETFAEQGAKEILESYGANGGGAGSSDQSAAADLLKGLQVVADSRGNSVTLIGTPRKVEIAAGILQQLDIRKRQAAVSVKIIDVNLGKTKDFSTDLQFRANNSLGFGFRPGGTNGGSGLGIVLGAAASPFSGGLTALTNSVLGSLFASIQNNNAKILTNPTLIVQEGSSAQVNLTEEIFSGVISTSSNEATSSGASTVAVTTKPNIRQAGVIFNVTVDRIDDNGFITLNLAPEVSAPSGGTFNVGGTTGTLINQRRLETGKIRLRDGQTLVLTGIIQDTDRVTVSKVPILGDIPLLGRLFRKESGEKSRKELVVMVTPRVLDDSQDNNVGYQYSPGADAQQLLNK